MLFKYTTTAAPVALDVVKDLIAIMTGTTDTALLSSSCDKTASQLLDAANPSGWSKKAEPATLSGMSSTGYIAVLESPLLTDGISRAYVPWCQFSTSNIMVYHTADQWDAVAGQLADSTGAVFSHTFNESQKFMSITANAVQDFYVYVKNTTIVVTKRSADAQSYPPLFCAEFDNIGRPKATSDLLPYVSGGVYAKSATSGSFVSYIPAARTLKVSGTDKQRVFGNYSSNNGHIAPPVGWEASANPGTGGAGMVTFMASTDAEAKVPFYPLWVWMGPGGVFGPLKDFPLFMLPYGFTASVGDTLTGEDGAYMVFGCGGTTSRKTVMRIGA